MRPSSSKLGVSGGFLSLNLGRHLGPPSEHRILAIKPTAIEGDRDVVRSGRANEAALELFKTLVDDSLRHVPRILP